MKTPNIEPYNSRGKSRLYVSQFVKMGPNVYSDVANYGRNLSGGEIVLILDLDKFYYIDKNLDGIKCKDVVKELLENAPAKFLGSGPSRFGGNIRETPVDIFASDLEFLCGDNIRRFMMNYSEGEGYIFLPHPNYLEKFLESLKKIPKQKLKKGIIFQLREYYGKIRE